MLNLGLQRRAHETLQRVPDQASAWRAQRRRETGDVRPCQPNEHHWETTPGRRGGYGSTRSAVKLPL